MERAANFSVRILRLVGKFITNPQKIWAQYVINYVGSYKKYKEQFTSKKAKEDSVHPANIIWTYVQTFPKYEILDCHLILFEVSQRQQAYQFRQDFGWQRYTKGDFTKIVLKGWHLDALTDDQNIKVIADELKNNLSKTRM